MSAAAKLTLYENMVQFVNEYILSLAAESMRLLPDSVVLGTAILTALSLCQSYGVLLLAMVEMMLIQRLAGTFMGGIAPIGAGPQALQSVCQPGFVFPNNMRISIVETIGKPSLFPSPVMFFLTGVTTYMIGSMSEFSKEIKTLGGETETRSTVAMVLSGLFVFALFLFRFSYGCETFGAIFMSALFGLVVGILVLMQNKRIFGREGINLLNLPIIKTMDERGKPMYVCAPSK
jgi:hypothetical protein